MPGRVNIWTGSGRACEGRRGRGCGLASSGVRTRRYPYAKIASKVLFGTSFRGSSSSLDRALAAASSLLEEDVWEDARERVAEKVEKAVAGAREHVGTGSSRLVFSLDERVEEMAGTQNTDMMETKAGDTTSKACSMNDSLCLLAVLISSLSNAKGRRKGCRTQTVASLKDSSKASTYSKGLQ